MTRAPTLSGPILRDTARLSQRNPPIARYGVSGVSTWPIGCDTPLPLFWAFPPRRACEVGVRYPPPQKGVGYLSDTCAIPNENKANGCETPLCDTISKRSCAICPEGPTITKIQSRSKVLQSQSKILISLENFKFDVSNSPTKIGPRWVAHSKVSFSLEIFNLARNLEFFWSLGPRVGPNLEKKTISLERLKTSSFRLNFSISLENFNLAWNFQSWPWEFPTLIGVWWVARLKFSISLENYIRFTLAWKFQSRRAILKFFKIWALWAPNFAVRPSARLFFSHFGTPQKWPPGISRPFWFWAASHFVAGQPSRKVVVVTETAITAKTVSVASLCCIL